MSSTVASNAWAEIVHHASDGILEERWLPGPMTDGAFMASLALLALEAERLRPSAILIDATQFQYRPGPAVMESFRRRGFLGGAALSSGLGVHSAALKQAREGATDRSAAAQDRCAVIQ